MFNKKLTLAVICAMALQGCNSLMNQQTHYLSRELNKACHKVICLSHSQIIIDLFADMLLQNQPGCIVHRHHDRFELPTVFKQVFDAKKITLLTHWENPRQLNHMIKTYAPWTNQIRHVESTHLQWPYVDCPNKQVIIEMDDDQFHFSSRISAMHKQQQSNATFIVLIQ